MVTRPDSEEGHVRHAVAVEVGGADQLDGPVREDAPGIGEGPAAQAGQHPEGVRARVDRHQVGDASPGERADGHARRLLQAHEGGRAIVIGQPVEAVPGVVARLPGEGRVAPVGQDADVAGGLVRDDQVDRARLVDVGEAEVRRAQADGQVVEQLAEAAEAVAEVDRRRAVAGVADHQVGEAVAVEVGRRDLRRQPAGRERADADEPAVAACEQRDRVGPGVDAGDQGPLITVEDRDVARGDAGIDDDGRLEGPRLLGPPLPPEDLAGLVDDEHVVGPVLIQVGQEGRGVGGGGERARVGRTSRLRGSAPR